MGEEGNEMMEKLESPSTKEGEEERKVIQIYSTSSEEEPIICLRDMDMKKLEETQDCFILDFDPFDSNIHLSSLSITEEHVDSDDADLHVISQKGQVQLNPTTPLTFLQMGLPLLGEKSENWIMCVGGL